MWLQALAAVAIVIPLGLDLYMPVPEDNPLVVESIELARRLFSDRRLSRNGVKIAEAPRCFLSPSLRMREVRRRTAGIGRQVLVRVHARRSDPPVRAEPPSAPPSAPR